MSKTRIRLVNWGDAVYAALELGRINQKKYRVEYEGQTRCWIVRPA